MAPKSDKAQRFPFKRMFARRLRADATESERKLWALLRRHQLDNLRFRRQQTIGPYVVDLFCPSAKLIIELDGSQHGTDNIVAYDAARTRFLESRGFRVLRFWNHELLKEPESVIEAICRATRPD